MKRFNTFIKGTLVAIMLSMILGLTSNYNAYAQNDSGVDDIIAAGEQSDLDGPNPLTANPENSFEFNLRGLTKIKATPASTSREIVDDVAKMATKVHRLFAPWINYFAFQIGNFLGNDYVFEGAMGDMLHRIWVISRNLVNIIFVFLLLLLALKTIFGVKESGYDDLKKSLAKFVILLIFVNFSWLATKVVLDAASVVTHIVFAIPSGISGNTDSKGKISLPPCKVDTLGIKNKPLTGACSPTAIFAPTDAGTTKVSYWEAKDCKKVEEAYNNAYKDGKQNPNAEKENRVLWKRTSMCMENMNFFKYDKNTAVIYLTYGMARIQNLVNATSGDDAIQLSVGVIMSLIMQAAYAIALTALFLALVVRMLVLWLFVGFSPFLILVMYFNEDMFGNDERVGVSIGWKEFTKWAFVPAAVGGIFAVSFIMISAGQSLGDVVINNVANKSGVTHIDFNGESLFMGLESMQSFVWMLMSIAVLWMGVFAVLGKMSIIGGMADYVSSQTKDKARLIAKLPLIAPILPTKNGSSSVGGMLNKLDFTNTLRKWDSNNRAGTGDIGTLARNAKKIKAEDIRINIGDTKKLDKIAKRFNPNVSGAKELVDRYSHEDIKSAVNSIPNISSTDSSNLLAEFSRVRSNAPLPSAPSPAKKVSVKTDASTESGANAQ